MLDWLKGLFGNSTGGEIPPPEPSNVREGKLSELKALRRKPLEFKSDRQRGQIFSAVAGKATNAKAPSPEAAAAFLAEALAYKRERSQQKAVQESLRQLNSQQRT